MKQKVTITGENINVVVDGALRPAEAGRVLSKAELRIAALRAAGVDTSMYFPMGSDKVVKIEGGAAVPVDMGDDVEKEIAEGGYVNHYKLFRRWVLSQVFHMLRDMEQSGRSFNEELQRKGYEYQWRMLERELTAQAKMHRHGDTQNFEARNRWFNRTTAAEMAADYITSLKRFIDGRLTWRTTRKGRTVYKHRCKGVPYVRLSGRNVFVADLQRKVYAPLHDAVRDIERAASPSELLAAVQKFNAMRKGLAYGTKQSASFIDAYKGSGAYFTMRNLILFHGARFHGAVSESSSLDYLEQKAEEYSTEGWRLFGVMKQLIADSGISVSGKLASFHA